MSTRVFRSCGVEQSSLYLRALRLDDKNENDSGPVPQQRNTAVPSTWEDSHACLISSTQLGTQNAPPRTSWLTLGYASIGVGRSMLVRDSQCVQPSDCC